MLDFGYPFFDFRINLSATERLMFFAGYRGLYGMNNGGYAGLKLGLFEYPERRVGLALTALGGYLYVPARNHDTVRLVGTNGGFGEVALHTTVRSRRHGLLVGAGLRVSQLLTCRSSCFDYPVRNGAEPASGVLATASFEVGYELRLMRFASYYVAVGIDLFTNSAEIPAMFRLRNGVILDF